VVRLPKVIQVLICFQLCLIAITRDVKLLGARIMNKHKRAGIVLLALVLVSVFSAWAIAGDLEPTADPAPTMHSLEDIYNKLEAIDEKVSGVVAKTGQKTSYATGDDGEKEIGSAWPVPRFTDNGDGTVTDNLTGLIWLQNASRFGQVDWYSALIACNDLAADDADLRDGSVAGDWRLPNVKELLTLIDYGRFSPALPDNNLFDNVQFEPTLDNYWSSTTNAHKTEYLAWNVAMNHGNATGASKAFLYWVWPVRGGN
jgi:hypothetical protein